MMASDVLSTCRPLRSCHLHLLRDHPATTALAETAGPADDPREVASAHYAEGIELANQGLYQAALEQFNAAYDTSPHFAVLYNVGQAQMALGRPIEARRGAVEIPARRADQVPLRRRAQVQAQIRLLESRLAELSVTTDRPGPRSASMAATSAAPRCLSRSVSPPGRTPSPLPFLTDRP